MNNNRIITLYMATTIPELRIGCRNKTQTNERGLSVVGAVCVCDQL